MPRRAVVTRRQCNTEDNVQDVSKLSAICKLQRLRDKLLHNVEISLVTAIRTDTTLDLSQKAEKSILPPYSHVLYIALPPPTIFYLHPANIEPNANVLYDVIGIWINYMLELCCAEAFVGMDRIQEISIGPYMHSTEALRDGSEASNEYLASFLACLTSTGFLFLTGHSISSSEVSGVLQYAGEFFSQSEEQKLLWLNKDRAKRGYSPYESDNFACLIGEHKPNDLVEKLRFGPEIDACDSYYMKKEAKAHFMANSWIEPCNDFRAAVLSYYTKMEQLTLRLLEITALALRLSHNYFTSAMARHTSILTLNHYPHLDSSQQLRIAQHTDISLLTIIAQSSAEGGLQIHSNGEWIDVPFVPNALVVNVGDCLAHWTSNVLKSTLHRVVAPKDLHQDNARLSVAYFAAPEFDAPLVPIFSMMADKEKSTEEAVLTYTKWRKKRIKEAMNHLTKL